MFRLASQHIYCARCLILLCILVREERTGKRVGNSSARLILVQRPLKRAHQHLAFGAIVEDHAKTRVRAALGVCEYLAHSGHIRLLPANNKPATGPDLSLQFEGACLPDAGFDLLLNLLKEWFETIEVFTLLAIGDFLGRAFFLSRAD